MMKKKEPKENFQEVSTLVDSIPKVEAYDESFSESSENVCLDLTSILDSKGKYKCSFCDFEANNSKQVRRHEGAFHKGVQYAMIPIINSWVLLQTLLSNTLQRSDLRIFRINLIFTQLEEKTK